MDQISGLVGRDESTQVFIGRFRSSNAPSNALLIFTGPRSSPPLHRPTHLYSKGKGTLTRYDINNSCINNNNVGQEAVPE